MSFSGNARAPRTPTPPQGETRRVLRHLPRGAEGGRPPRGQGVPRAAGHDRRRRPEDGRAGHRAPLLPAGGPRRVPVRRLVRPLRRPAAQPVHHAGRAEPLVPAILIGGAFGLLFAILTYSFSRGKRDFTSTSQIVASSYAVLCRAEQAHKARELLREIGGVQSGWPARPRRPDHHHKPVGSVGCVPAGCGPADPWGSPTVPPVAPPGPPAPPSGPPSDASPGRRRAERASARALSRAARRSRRSAPVDLRGVGEAAARLAGASRPSRTAGRAGAVHVCLPCRGCPSHRW